MSDNMSAYDAADEAGSGNRRVLFVAGGAAAAVALAAGGYFLVGGGGGSSAAPAPIRRGIVKQDTTTSAKGTGVQAVALKPATSLPPVSAARLGRDPFKALYILPVTAPVAAPAATTPIVTIPVGTTPVGTTPVGTTPVGTTPTTAPATQAPATTPTTPPKPVASTYALKLTRVYGTGVDTTASFAVGSKTQLAKVGSVFGRTQELKLLSLQQNDKGVWVAVVQVGDSDPFDVAIGQTLYVM